MEDGLFPSYMTIISEDPMDIEEERRLCYVGITRAMEHLTITSARLRMVRGETQYNKVSRFVKEIPSDLLHGSMRTERIPEEPFREAFEAAKRSFDRKPYGMGAGPGGSGRPEAGAFDKSRAYGDSGKTAGDASGFSAKSGSFGGYRKDDVFDLKTPSAGKTSS